MYPSFIFIILFFALLLYILVTPNAIHALLALILLFIQFSLLLFVFDSSFLAFSYILVYIGAICVLFLYIILLLHLRTYSLLQRTNFVLLLSLVIGFVAIFTYSNITSTEYYSTTPSYDVSLLTDLYLFTSYLFVTHQIHLLLGMFLLLLALVLSIFLSLKFISENKEHKLIFNHE